MTADELRYKIDQHLGKPKRYSKDRDGLEESPTGEWVKHSEYKEEIAKLHEIINQLKVDASKEYHKGYNEGKSAGPDYNMRNDF